MSWEYWTPEPAPQAKADIAIPPKALEAGVKAFAEAEANDYTTRDEDLCTAFRAMLENWEGMSQLAENDSASIREMAAIILPLPQENPDDQ